MTVKQFLKSNAFKCILVLTCIALVASGLLAILNDLLSVSDEERTARAIQSIYGEAVGYEDLTASLDATYASNEYGSIDNLYKLENGALMFKSTGKDGYKGGTVSLWVVAQVDGNGDFVSFEKVVYAENSKQTLMSQFKQSTFDIYTVHNDKIAEGGYWWVTADDAHVSNLVSGATKSSQAVNNAINSALYYLRNVRMGGDAQ